ncbi:MAG: hypothetical protein AAF634_06895 [Bacteroidota bacterium]
MSSDWELLEEIKHQVELKSGLTDRQSWTQKDYDFLSFYIQNETGCRLSVSTLKRIWTNQYHRLPHISTLDALTQVAFATNWKGLKAERLSRKVSLRRPPKSQGNYQLKPDLRRIAVAVLVLLPLILVFFSMRDVLKKGDTKPAKVNFDYRKTVDNQLPNTVVFTYDIEEVQAEHFFLQQSWDSSRRVELFKGTSERTDIYYIPGYFTAKLIADDQLIATTPVHVTYEDWFIAIRQPISNIITFGKQHWLGEDYLALDNQKITAKGIDINQKFQQAFYQVRDFGLDGDNLTHKTTFRMAPLEAVDCPMISIHIQGVYGYYWVMLGNKGCGSELFVTIGDKQHNGKTEDLTMLATNVYTWNDVEIRTEDKNVVLKLNGESVFSTSYMESVGPVMEISYFFDGLGMIDNVELQNSKGESVFRDDFTSVSIRE